VVVVEQVPANLTVVKAMEAAAPVAVTE